MRDAFAVSVVSGIFQSKAVWQFAQMIECVQPDTNALAYNEYGCWCGIGGKGAPVDGVDRYVHGWRTGERLQKGKAFSGVCGPAGAAELMTTVTRRAGRLLGARLWKTFPTSSNISSAAQSNR